MKSVTTTKLDNGMTQLYNRETRKISEFYTTDYYGKFEVELFEQHSYQYKKMAHKTLDSLHDVISAANAWVLSA